ncbi:MAG: M14 family zinc carboxypeptidase [Acidobacteriaceae bacterium]
MSCRTWWRRTQFSFMYCSLVAGMLLSVVRLQAQEAYARDAKQPIDQAYTQHIAKYTTEPYFNSPLTDYLPASKTVPTPAKVLGDVSGAPNMLPYAEDVYKYFRMLAAASPRVKVFTIGHTEEGREMIAVAIADESLLANLKENDARLAQLADPRTIGMNDATAAKLVVESTPVYYITGTIHSPETGAPTALMELAYRLAVDDSPYIQHIRSHVITLITPVVEVDGRDRMVDIYKWHRAHPGERWPRLIYWGHYVAHDNNRDSMALTLDLSRNVLTTYLAWHAQVLHDLHESVPFLYDNTVGAGPYNAWIDPMLTTEWTMLGWNNVGQMENFGMPGAFTHGDFDTWSPGYLMFLAAMHNGISRLYETFGNGGADTEERILSPDEYSRTWFRPNPPLPKVLWSQRDNNNYEETALLATLSYFSQNTKLFLHDYYLKSKRSILKPENAGPAAYVLPADASATDRQARLLQVMERQHVEISQTTAPMTAQVPDNGPAQAGAKSDGAKSGEAATAEKTISRTFPAGSYVIRMDQPYSRVADALLDRQYWAPDDPQKHPYDDTGWTFGELFNVEVVRVTDTSILKASMKRVDGPIQGTGSVQGSGPVYAIGNSGELSLITLRYALKDADISIADAPFHGGGRDFSTGTLLLQKVSGDGLQNALRGSSLRAYSIAAMPQVRTHPTKTPRIALMHTWLRTQTEGWWREALDNLHVPYAYISTQTVSREDDLRAKYDVILFAPVGGASPERIVNGVPMYGNPIPWQTTPLTPNIGKIDSTPDIRPGLGYAGVEHLKNFVRNGGLLVTSEDTSVFAIQEGFAPGVFVAPKGDVRVVGSVLQSVVLPSASPILCGFGKTVPVYSANGMSFQISNLVSGGFRLPTAEDTHRPTGRGGPHGEDIPQGRPFFPPPPLPVVKRWQAVPLNAEQMRNNPFVIPTADRPQVMLRFADEKDLLLSGLLKNGGQLVGRVAVVVAHLGGGNVLLFANNPIYRGETIGTYPLVFNAILNFDGLSQNSSAH